MHPYTVALLASIPSPDPEAARGHAHAAISGDVPSPIDPPSGCVFRTRCFQAQEKCAVEVPPLVEVSPGHFLACHFPVAVPPQGERIVAQGQPEFIDQTSDGVLDSEDKPAPKVAAMGGRTGAIGGGPDDADVLPH